MSAFHPLSGLTAATRDAGHPVALRADSHAALSWDDLFRGVAALRAHIDAHRHRQWVLYTESTPHFLMGLLALLQSGREIVLPANMQSGSVAEASGPDTMILDEGTLARIAASRSEATPDTLAATDPHRVVLRFHTSGSTGSPKVVSKRLDQIEKELANLHALWGPDLVGRRVRSSVSHQHIYGFLFSATLPLCMGLAISTERLASLHTLERLQGEASVLVLSPAFLKRALQDRDTPYRFTSPPIIFSSGGSLPRETAEAAERIFGARPREIYGSTETGGIAYRTAGGDEPWRCFSGVRIRIGQSSRIEVQSPYLPDDEFLATGDAGRLLSDGSFSLLGRTDSIAKIEEKRVSLDEVGSRIRESPLVEDAHVAAFEGSRQFLAAVVVLSPAGKSRFASASRRDITTHFRGLLLAWFEPTVLPRKWRFVESIPRDALGKVPREAILAMFDREDDQAALSLEPDVTAVDTDGSRLSISLDFPANSIYFHGHFPSFRLLPAVVQVDWVMRFVRRHMGVTDNLEEIVRLKFSRPILPTMPLRLEINREPEKDQIEFRYLHGENGQVLSSGRMKLERRS